MSDEKSCQLPEVYWRRILNLLTEELEAWEEKTPDHKQIRAMIFQIENQTGIRKKPRSAEVEKSCDTCCFRIEWEPLESKGNYGAGESEVADECQDCSQMWDDRTKDMWQMRSPGHQRQCDNCEVTDREGPYHSGLAAVSPTCWNCRYFVTRDGRYGKEDHWFHKKFHSEVAKQKDSQNGVECESDKHSPSVVSRGKGGVN